MPLAPGSKLGPYEILSPLGSGGMGEVYRARDTRLDRSVAIKILPAHLSADPARKQRFEREAKTISGLNHPNICTLHDVGSLDGLDYLVMECVEGESLAARLEKGPLLANQVLKIGAELADALDKAHRSGIVHRDLKPANIMLTKSGAKLLDFGLAKPTAPQATLATLTSALPQQSPVTQEGTIVGTFQYMSPEQVEGKELDARSDIFSLGTVLYEMLTGKRAFDGKSQLSIASAILEKDPAPIAASVPLTPPALDHAIGRCLAKDPDDRWQTARDLALELKWVATPAASTDSARPVAAPKSKNKFKQYLPYLIEAAAIVAAAYFLAPRLTRTTATNERVTLRAALLPPEKSQFASIETDEGGVPAVSPDGRYVLSPVHEGDGKVRLWLRPVQATQGKILPGTEGAGHAFWSPDSHSIGFFANGKLKRTDLDGSAPYNIADAALGRGGSWNSGGTILFSPAQSQPLFKVSATGGTPLAVTKLDKAQGNPSHRWPQFLPDGHHFLFTLRSDRPNETGLYAASLDDPQPHLVLSTTYNASYVSPGYILFVRDDALFAQRFDTGSLKLLGDPIPLPDRVALFSPALNAIFSASDSGLLAYYPQQAGSPTGASLVWYDRSGKKSDLVTQMFLTASEISPEGSSVALSGYAPNEWLPKLWKFDFGRGTRSLLTQGYGTDPIWTPDGQSIYFSHIGSYNTGQIHKVSASGGGSEETILAVDGYSVWPATLCHDGQTLLYGQAPLGDTNDVSVWSMSLNGGAKPAQLIAADQRPSRLAFSADCNWVAYETRLTGNREISILHFPDGAQKYQVSTSGGFNPKWRQDGKELFYYSPFDSSIVSVSVGEKGQALSLGKPTPLFQVHPFAPRLGVFDITPDAQKFLVFGDTSSYNGTPLYIVQNWDAQLAPH
jgi:serine/threonine protein kinase/Tol biopolymer transport system component